MSAAWLPTDSWAGPGGASGASSDMVGWQLLLKTFTGVCEARSVKRSRRLIPGGRVSCAKNKNPSGEARQDMARSFLCGGVCTIP